MKRWYLLVIAVVAVLALWLFLRSGERPASRPAGTAAAAPSPPSPATARPPPPVAPAEAIAAAAGQGRVERAPAGAGGPQAPAPVPREAATPPAEVAAATRPPGYVRGARGPGLAGHVRGRVVGPDGRALSRYRLNGTEVRDPDGAFRMTAPAGSDRMRLVIQAEGFAPSVVHASVPAGADVTLPDVVVGPGVDLIGEVLDADTLEPVPDARATLADPVEVETVEQGQFTRLVEPGVTGKGGYFLVSHAPVGLFLLVVSHPGYRLEVGEIGTGEDTPHVRLHRGGSVAGRVVAVDGRPLPGVEVVALSRSALDAREARTDADGRFQIGHVRPGRYAVLPLAGGEMVAPQAVEVAEGRTAKADFRSRSGGTTLRVRILDARGDPAAGEALLAPGDVARPTSFAGLVESTPVLVAAGRSNPQVIPHVPPGRYTLFVLHDAGGREPSLHRESVVVDGGGDHLVEVRLPEKLPPPAPPDWPRISALERF